MAVAFMRGTTTGPSDLTITVRDSGGTLIDPYRLEYAIFDATTGSEVLIGSPVNYPVKISTGSYYAPVVIPADANIGVWHIRWTIQEMAADPVYQSVQEFQVVGSGIIASFTGDANLDALIHSLRIILRDNNPDRNYRFRPPATEKFIQGQTQVFGFIWEDEELLEYLYMAIDDFNSRPPVTGIEIGNLWGSERRWRTTVILRAAAFACFAIAMNWIADEFSIGGESKVTIKIKDKEKDITIAELFNALYGDYIEKYGKEAKSEILKLKYGKIISHFYFIFQSIKGRKKFKSKIKKAFEENELYVKSYDKSDKNVVWKQIKDVMRHYSKGKKIFKVNADGKTVIATEDHSLFEWITHNEIKTSELTQGSFIVAQKDNKACPFMVNSIKEDKPREYMYDLSVPGTENFFLSSGILAHNTYSISGVSLDIEKSSKYQSMKDEYIAEYDKLVEQNKLSIKIIKGLRQFRYGVGITSALGPLNRPGVQSRRNMIAPGYGAYV